MVKSFDSLEKFVADKDSIGLADLTASFIDMVRESLKGKAELGTETDRTGWGRSLKKELYSGL